MEIKSRTVKLNEVRGDPIWKLAYLEVVAKEGRKFLNDGQYFHAIQLCEELAYEPNPLESKTQDVRQIQDFYELRDKGGILGNINLRIYFAIFDKESAKKIILILSTIKKEDEDQVAQHIIFRIRHRLRNAKEQLEKSSEKDK